MDHSLRTVWVSRVRRNRLARLLWTAILLAAVLPAPAAEGSRAFAASVVVQLGGSPFDVVPDAGRGVAYVSLPDTDEVVTVDLGTESVTARTFFSDPRGLELSDDGGSLYVALNSSTGIADLDLVTGTSSTIVLADLGDSRTWDVIEAIPGVLLVSANPGSSGFSYIVRYDTATDTADRVAGEKIIRAGPRFATDGASYAYVGEGFSPNSLYQLDLSTPGYAISHEDPHGGVEGAQRLDVSPDGSTVVLGAGQKIDSATFVQIGSYAGGVPTFSTDGSLVYVLRFDEALPMIGVYDTVTTQLVDEFDTSCDFGTRRDVTAFTPVPGTDLLLAAGDTSLCIIDTADVVVSAGNVYVSTAGSDANDCWTPATPCATFARALSRAGAGDNVYVAEGTYTGAGAQVMRIEVDLTVTGGWDAAFTTQTGTSTIDGQNVRGGIWIDATSTVSLDRFEVRNAAGEAAIVNHGSLTVTSSSVRDNLDGGISSTGASSLTLDLVSVTGNEFTGVYTTGSAMITSSLISGNGDGFPGITFPGITNFGDLTLTSSPVNGNAGGGIQSSGTLVMDEGSVRDNGSTGLWVSGGSATVTSSTISGNSTCDGSSCSSMAGGIENWGDMTLTNSTVSENRSGAGAGIDNGPGGTMTIANSTILDNAASRWPNAGVQNDGTLTIGNSILHGGTNDRGDANCIGSGDMISADYNLIGSFFCPFTVLGAHDVLNVADVGLGALADNGGPTETHAPLLGSPAIDGGNPAVPGSGGGACEAVDQRGVVRPQGARCDVGSVELQFDGWISGTIVDEDGDPVAMGRVDVFDEFDYIGSVGADVDGHYEAAGLAAGTYWLVLYNGDDDFYIGYFPEWYEDAPLYRTDLATGIEVTSGEVPGVDAMLLPFFEDMFETVFTDDIFWMQAIGASEGCGDHLYCVNDPIPRGVMADQMAKALLLPPVPEDWDPFTDDDGSPYEDSIERMAQAGITYGCNPPENTLYCPDRTLIRGEMAAFFVRALDLVDDGGGDLFDDDDDSVFNHDIDRLATAGITYGCNPPENTKFCPDRILTYGEIAAFIHRALRGDLWPEAADPAGDGLAYRSN